MATGVLAATGLAVTGPDPAGGGFTVSPYAGKGVGMPRSWVQTG